jgi:phage terminase small subunit
MVDNNATQAAIRAGYSEDTAKQIGSENLSKPAIAKEIEKRLERRSKRLDCDADYVLSTIREMIEKSRDSDSELYDPAIVLKGAELIGKTLKLFTDKLEIEGDAVKITNVLLNI